MGNQGQCLLSHFNKILNVYAYTRSKYQVSVYRIIGPLVNCTEDKNEFDIKQVTQRNATVYRQRTASN